MKRVRWIDQLRAFAIISIVLGHALGQLNLGSSLFNHALYLYHVPLCLTISGYLFSVRRGFDNGISFVKKIFVRQMVPYYIWGIISIGIYCLMFCRHDIMSEGGRYLLGLLYANGSLGRGADSSGLMVWNTPMWYLPCAFTMEVMVTLLVNIFSISNVQKAAGAMVVAIATGLVFYEILGVHSLFMEIESAIYLMPFFFLGMLLNRASNRKKEKKNTLLTSIGLILFGEFMGFINGSPGYLSDGYGKNYVLFVVSAGMICSGMFRLFELLDMSGKVGLILQYVGNRTLEILVMHKFPIMAFVLILKLLPSRVPFGLLTALGITVGSIILCLACGEIINNLCPFMIGKKKKHKFQPSEK